MEKESSDDGISYNRDYVRNLFEAYQLIITCKLDTLPENWDWKLLQQCEKNIEQILQAMESPYESRS